MSSPMQRITSRPFGRNTQSLPPQAPAPETDPGEQASVTDYMIREDDELREHWLNPHVAAFHSSRSRQSTQGRPGAIAPTPLRMASSEQRAAYIAQRDAENAAAMSPSLPAPPPTPVVSEPPPRSSSLQAPAAVVPLRGRRVSPQSLDVPRTPANSSDPDASDEARAAASRPPLPAAEDINIPAEPIDRLPTPPPAPVRTSRVFTPPPRNSLLTALSESLASPIHMVPPRRRNSLQARSDVEVEVRGSGAERTVIIRFMAVSGTSSGATATR